MRLTVEQIRQRLRAQRPCHKVRHAPHGVGDTGRPAARIAGSPLREAPARVTRARQKSIRVKLLRFLDSGFRKQVRTGRCRRIGNNFRH